MENKVSMEIFNPINENIKKLENLFPGVVKDGQVDFEALKQELGQFEEVGKEKYELTWPGKTQAKQLANTDIIGKTLKYVPEDSKNPETTENLYIEGDNLEVLKLLRNSYYGKVKMIYIDPPYNTGNDFVYKDNFAMGVTENEKIEGNIDEEGNKLIKNQQGSGRFHSNWLNMMYPRLKIAKDLLKDDGVIFISIDDNEMDNLKKICDEIFGEASYVSTIVLEITKTQGMKVKAAQEGSIVKNYEYILCYTKSGDNKKIVKNLLYDKNEGYDTHFFYYITKKDDEFVIKKLVDVLKENKDIYEEFRKYGLLKNGNISINSLEKAMVVSEKVKQYIYSDISENIYQEMACNISIDPNIKDYLDKKNIVEYENYLLTKSSGGKLRQYSSLHETLKKNDEYISEYGRVTIRGNLWKGFYSDMMNVTKEGNIEFKNGKKPVRLIFQLAKWIGVKSRDVVLDFFSGSATTAHAVIQLNAEDGGHRKFIMVQIPEPCDEKSEAYKAGYKNICEIGKERIRRAGEKIKEEFKDKEGIEKLDVGFKVFRVADTNIRWKNNSVEEIEDLYTKGLSKDALDFNPGFTDIDVVYEIMLRHRGFPLTSKINKLSNIGNRTYIFADAVVVCLEEKITNEIIDGIAAIEPKPIKVIFRDSAFDDDISLKLNTMNRLDAQLKKHNQGKDQSYRVEFI